MKVKGGGHYLRAVNDGARTVLTLNPFITVFNALSKTWGSWPDMIYRTRAIINRSQIVNDPL